MRAGFSWVQAAGTAGGTAAGFGGDFVVVNVNPLTLVGDAIASRGVETVSIKTTLDIDDSVVHRPNSNKLLPSVGKLAGDQVAGFQVW
jgi:hypothetical protein